MLESVSVANESVWRCAECLWQQDGVKPNLCVCVQGMTEAEEDKLLALKDFMLKSNKAKANMGEQTHLGEAAQTGVIDLATLGITGRQVDLVKPKPEAEDKRGAEFHYVYRISQTEMTEYVWNFMCRSTIKRPLCFRSVL